MSVTDDGCGIDVDSLALACTRFATSKIVKFDDLKGIKTFGFRGEALASCSMVGRVTVTSRRRGDRCAYKMNFRDGAPVSEFGSTNEKSIEVKPKPCAGKEGTTILVQDLFYNVPSRRKAMEGKRNEREEYDRILAVVQRYAVHEARRGVGFLCRGSGRGGKQCDLNTQSVGSVKKIAEKRKREQSKEVKFGELEIAAVKDVIGHVFGSDVIRELLPLSAGEGDVSAVGLEALKAMAELSSESIQDVGAILQDEKAKSIMQSAENNNQTLLDEMMMSVTEDRGVNNKSPTVSSNNEKSYVTESTNARFSFAYKATGLITNGSYSAPKSSVAFLLFINDRLVESPSLRRAVESIYADTLPKGGKPFIYLSLELPGPHIDVNVHPTKKEVALLHEDQLCDALMAAVREVIGSATSSRTFAVAGSSLLLPEKKQSILIQKRDAVNTRGKGECDDELNKCKNTSRPIDSEEDNDGEIAEDELKTSSIVSKRKLDSNEDSKPTKSTKKRYDPSRLVRTNHAALAGALEPFLVKKNSVVNADSTINNNTDDIKADQPVRHQPECPLSSQTAPDMSMPGAFATAICRCQVKQSDNLPSVSTGITVRNNPANNVIRPKKITPTECDYSSISELRANIHMRNHQSLNETLRGSSYVGAISRNRSLIQCGIDLLMINHRDLACEVFYQLALLKFGDIPMAGLGGGGVHIMTVIGDYLQTLENDDIEAADSKQNISKKNVTFARQAVARLAEKAPMLEDYFSIKFERRRVQGSSQRESLWLTGLPILLEGHCPQPYALPLFLLRLATEVDWTAERPCFEGICKEIGSYYAEIPLSSSNNDSSNVDNNMHSNVELIDDETKAYVKHTLYPIISHLLVPPKDLATKGSVVKLANLTSLYKVFERC